jgi:hypothetical protein
MTPMQKFLEVERVRDIVLLEMRAQGVGLTELADRAELLPTTVYRYITHRTKHPWQETMASLLDALSMVVNIDRQANPNRGGHYAYGN